ncbi:MAG: hypothetical protein ACI88H_001100 [Cocleimonas sp.]
MYLNKSNIGLCVISLAFILDTFLSAELAFIVIVFLYFWLLKFSKVNYMYLLVAISLFISLLIGLYDNDISVVIKDFWYFSKPYLFFLSGYLYVKKFNNLNLVFYFLLVICIADLLIYLVPVILSFGDILVLTADDFRDTYGKGSVLFVIGYALCFIIYNETAKKIYLLLAGLFFVSLVITQSRFLLLISIVYFLLYFFDFRVLHKYIYLSIMSVMLFMTFPVNDITSSNAERETFIDKVVFSISEIRPQEYLFDSDIHQHWRGYETYMAMNHYLDSGFMNIFFGKGFGESVAIDFAKRRDANDESDIRLYKLEWLHNGYVTILLKSGVVGLIIFLFLFYRLIINYIFNIRKSPDELLYITLIYYFLIATFFVGGVVSKSGILIPLFILGSLTYKKIGLVNERFDGAPKF